MRVYVRACYARTRVLRAIVLMLRARVTKRGNLEGGLQFRLSVHRRENTSHSVSRSPPTPFPPSSQPGCHTEVSASGLRLRHPPTPSLFPTGSACRVVHAQRTSVLQQYDPPSLRIRSRPGLRKESAMEIRRI